MLRPLHVLLPVLALMQARKRKSLADYVGKELPAVFLEVDEVRAAPGHTQTVLGRLLGHEQVLAVARQLARNNVDWPSVYRLCDSA